MGAMQCAPNNVPHILSKTLHSCSPWHQVLIKLITDEHTLDIQLDGAATLLVAL